MANRPQKSPRLEEKSIVNSEENNQSSKPPLVSVVVMAYQRVDYLRVTMNSLLSQSMADFEIIVSDDSASPEIQRLCENYKDNRIQYIANKPRLGMIQNAKSGMRLAHGKYIANIHDDDFVDEHFLEKMIAPMERDEHIGLVFCDHKIVDSEGVEDSEATELNTQKWGRSNLSEGYVNNKFEAFITGIIPIPSARLFRKDSINIDEIHDETSILYDWWMSFLHAKSNYQMYYLSSRYTSYRIHDQSTTSSSDGRLAPATLFIMNYLAENNYIRKDDPFYRKKITESCLSLTRKHLGTGEIKKVRIELNSSLKDINKPLYIVAYSLTLLPSPLATKLIKKTMNARDFLRKIKRNQLK